MNESEIINTLKKHNSAKVGSVFELIYPKLFVPKTDEETIVLEIGNRRGETFRSLLDIFPNGYVYGIDIGTGGFKKKKTINIEKRNSRAKFFIGDQSNVTFLKNVSSYVNNRHGGFDIVLDDGGHTMDQQLTSFKELWKYIRPGGFYCIEDTDTSYYTDKKWGSRSYTTIDFLKSLVDVIHRDFMKISHSNNGKVKGTYSVCQKDEDIFSVSFYKCCCVVTKHETGEKNGFGRNHTS